MKTRPTLLRRALLACSVAFLLAGCLTTTDVKNAVNEANHAMLAAEAGPITDLVTPRGTEAGEISAALTRLNAFEESQSTPAMHDALRLRRALMHLNSGAYALAEAAFEEIKKPEDLSRRDQALFEVRATMLWWWQQAPVTEPGEFARIKATATAHQAALLSTAQKSSTPVETADYLREMQAWIGIKLAFDLADRAETKRLLDDAVNQYTAPFTDAEANQVESGIAGAEKIKAIDTSARRVVRAQGMIEHIANLLAQRRPENRVIPQFARDPIQRYFERTLRAADPGDGDLR